MADDPLAVSPGDLRTTAKNLADVSSRMKKVLSDLQRFLDQEGPVWGNDSTGQQFANGDKGYLKQAEWVNTSINAKTGLLDSYADTLHRTATTMEQQDNGNGTPTPKTLLINSNDSSKVPSPKGQTPRLDYTAQDWVPGGPAVPVHEASSQDVSKVPSPKGQTPRLDYTAQDWVPGGPAVPVHEASSQDVSKVASSGEVTPRFDNAAQDWVQGGPAVPVHEASSQDVSKVVVPREVTPAVLADDAETPRIPAVAMHEASSSSSTDG